MKILYRYLVSRVVGYSFVAVTTLTLVVVLFNAAKRIFDLLVNNDVPIIIICKLVALLIPQVLTFTLPWGLLVAVLIVFGRASQNLELQAIHASGVGLAPLVAPILLFSLFVSMLCLCNNAVLAPKSMTEFKYMLVELGKNNPTAFIRAGEPITQFPGYRIWIGKKYGNIVEDIQIWEIDSNMIPKRSIRADRGLISADLNERSLTITLSNARQEQRGDDPTDLSKIQVGMRAQQLPFKISLGEMFDISKIEQNITVSTLNGIYQKMTSRDTPKNANMIPILTEFQKRWAFSFAPFTFVLVGIPLGIRVQRKETSVGLVVSLLIAISYYILVDFAIGLRERAGAYPELIMWIPNIAFQILGFWLLARANRNQA